MQSTVTILLVCFCPRSLLFRSTFYILSAIAFRPTVASILVPTDEIERISSRLMDMAVHWPR
uniref:Uncharacterized protein n=1 Tax=Picea glauca TaxID=3330 RepID=A0A101M0J4_PICGL|nr:hypothetical protein ABT39_MTgene4132 [Picea glauca]QHR86010.1 hypothetical protein Q903MT_gene8 [Picea sitchensis]